MHAKKEKAVIKMLLIMNYDNQIFFCLMDHISDMK